MLVRLYILGHFLDDAGFCNRVMDILAYDGAKGPPLKPFAMQIEDFCLAWAKTPVGSPLRAFILDFITRHMAHNNAIFQGFLESTCPRELFIDLFKHLESKHGLTKLLKPSTKLSKVVGKCEFHRHDEESPKCSEST